MGAGRKRSSVLRSVLYQNDTPPLEAANDNEPYMTNCLLRFFCLTPVRRVTAYCFLYSRTAAKRHLSLVNAYSARHMKTRAGSRLPHVFQEISMSRDPERTSSRH